MRTASSFLSGILSGEEKVKDFKSPYLEYKLRLADIIAALQAMGAYPYASRKFKQWEKKLGKPLSVDDHEWSTLFEKHPEFFKISEDGVWATLRWRHAYDRIYDTQEKRELDADEVKSLTKEDKDNLTRKTLTSDQIETLIKAAIELHSRAIALQQEARWWVPIVASLGGVIIGVIGVVLGAILT